MAVSDDRGGHRWFRQPGGRSAAAALAVALVLTAALATTSVTADAQSPTPDVKAGEANPKEKEADKAKEKEKEKDAARDDAEPVVTRHETRIGGRPLKYTATAGRLPIRNAKGETEAQVFFIAYTRDEAGEVGKRPLMFSFNGGPGSSSVWLHLGAVGPKRVVLPDDASFPDPPFRLVDNDASWLDRTDLVFIDPVGTGYSRAAKPELNKKFHGLKGDVASVGEFIRMYLTRYDRWPSPLYLVGESYGTTRAAGLSDHLVENGIALNGVVLVSSVLDFTTLDDAPNNDLPFLLFLPSFTATAWYHKRLAGDLQSDLKKATAEAEHWADTAYRAALSQGDRLPPDQRKAAVEALARYTGLSPEFVEAHDLRVSQSAFCKELLRAQKRTVGRLDGRYKGIDAQASGTRPGFDPSMAVITPPYTSTFNNYVRKDLGYRSDLTYHILGGEEIGAWDWGPMGMGYPETYRALRDAMAKNPPMKLFIASGYFDLATPYWATEFTLSHMQLDPALRRNVSTAMYEAGHMMYVHGPSLEALKRDVSAFLDGSRH